MKKSSTLGFLERASVKLVLEWLFWCALVAVLWSQTEAFSGGIAEYRFGAHGWPQMVLLGILIGATAQFFLEYLKLPKNKAKKTKTGKSTSHAINRYQQAAIFITPLIYLWLMHRIGFFVATPLFIAAYLRVLEVRDWRHIISVASCVYLVVLLIFVRFFYVDLPKGIWPGAYEINTQIITMVRFAT